MTPNINNKNDMIPISVVDKFVIPIREGIDNTARSVEKLSDSIVNLSDDIVKKIDEHDVDSRKRSDSFKESFVDKDHSNMIYIREMGNRLIAIEEDLSKINNSINSINDRIKLIITVVSVAFSLFMTMYGLSNVLIKHTAEGYLKQIIESRGVLNQANIKMYWIDNNGVKRYINVEKAEK